MDWNWFGRLTTVKQDDPAIAYLIKSLLFRYGSHKVSQAGAQIAFFFLLSTFPFVIFFNGIVGVFNLSLSKVLESLTAFIPHKTFSVFITYIDYMSANNSAKLISAGIVITLFSSSKLVRVVGQSINDAYDISDRRNILVSSLLSMAFTAGIAVVIVMTVFLIALSNNLVTQAVSYFKIPADSVNLFTFSGWAVILVILFFGLSLLYFFMPNKKITFRSVIPGTLFCMTGFLLSTVGFSVYANYMLRFSAYYGSIGAILLVLLWMYFSGMIVVLGAECNSVMALLKRRKNPPA